MTNFPPETFEQIETLDRTLSTEGLAAGDQAGWELLQVVEELIGPA
jgi:hypothetical protein